MRVITYEAFRAWLAGVQPQAAKLLDADVGLQRRVLELCRMHEEPAEVSPEVIAFLRRRVRGDKGTIATDVLIEALRLLGWEATSEVVAKRMTKSFRETVAPMLGLRWETVAPMLGLRCGTPRYALLDMIHGGITSTDPCYVGGNQPENVAALWQELHPVLRVGVPPENPEPGVIYISTLLNIDPQTFPGLWTGKGSNRYQDEPPRWWTGTAYAMEGPYFYGDATGVRIVRPDGEVYEGPTTGAGIWKFLYPDVKVAREQVDGTWQYVTHGRLPDAARDMLTLLELWNPRGLAKPRSDEAVARDRHCQVCFDQQAVVNGLIVDHGYAFPDHAYRVRGSQCAGSRQLPWEVDKSVCEGVLADDIARSAEILHELAKLRTIQAEKRRSIVKDGEEIRPRDPRWAGLVAANLIEVEATLRSKWRGGYSIPWRRYMLRTWAPSPVRIRLPMIRPVMFTAADLAGRPKEAE